MQKTALLLNKYDYPMPEACIAQKPSVPRDSARLLVYDRATQTEKTDTFRNLAKYLPERSVIVFNRTKVIPARLWCRKVTGGRVQVFYIRHDEKYVYAMCNRPLSTGAVVHISPSFYFTVLTKEDGLYLLKPSFPSARIISILERYGSTPIPPYIKHSPLTEASLRREYQTVFARTKGSVAAPTASLHFTPRLLRELKRAGHRVMFVTLHVGLGTFSPLTPEQLTSGKLHEEAYRIDTQTAHALSRLKKAGRTIVAVGTTVARTLESASNAHGALVRPEGVTDIFIREGYRWKFVDALITNFHVPKSSLMMLVASFVGRTKLLALYRAAIKQRMRFFSFGDGMLIR